MKLKEKVKQWLLKDELERFKEYEYLCRNAHSELEEATAKYQLSDIRLQKSTVVVNEGVKLNEQLKEIITPILDTGVDYGLYNDHSWAVVCVKGKPEYVKFMPLDSKDTRAIIDFLKHFDKRSRVIDSPLAFRNMVERRIID